MIAPQHSVLLLCTRWGEGLRHGEVSPVTRQAWRQVISRYVGPRLTLLTGSDETTSFPLSTLLYTFSLRRMHSFPFVVFFSQPIEIMHSLFHEVFLDYTELTMNFAPVS